MALFRNVLCAVDQSAVAPRVLRHAVGMAGLCGARLTVLTAHGADRKQTDADVQAMMQQVLPAGATYPAEWRVRAIRIARGSAADAVLEFVERDTDLVVAGTHARTGFSRWFLGSTSAALLDRATCPTMLVPPGDTDIVRLDPHRPHLDLAGVLVAVSPAGRNPAKLGFAGRLANLAGQPLVLMTVVEAHASEAAARRALDEAAAEAGARTSQPLLVPHGQVSKAIAASAAAQHAGLVVLGLRTPGSGGVGRVASEVLQSKTAVVLAVPAGWPLPPE